MNRNEFRILLTGKNGQLGAELASCLPCLGEVIARDRHQLDISDAGAIRRTIRELRPALIVNAAAYTAVDQAESDAAAAQAVNSEGPAIIAQEAKRIGAALVHYSTDYVFDGRKSAPYEEVDEVNPINVYGKTKLAGEQAIERAGLPYLIFRTSWVYGTRGRNFLLSILGRAAVNEELRVASDQVGAPTWSRAIAVASVQILAGLLGRRPRTPNLQKVSGIYHLTAAGETSRYGFARAILEECSDSTRLGAWFRTATGGRQLRAQRLIPTSNRDDPSSARRPAYSVLSNAKLQQAFRLSMLSWHKQLQLAIHEADATELQSPSLP
jgi:dTDP-4-dehydrorhamnose reductase